MRSYFQPETRLINLKISESCWLPDDCVSECYLSSVIPSFTTVALWPPSFMILLHVICDDFYSISLISWLTENQLAAFFDEQLITSGIVRIDQPFSGFSFLNILLFLVIFHSKQNIFGLNLLVCMNFKMLSFIQSFFYFQTKLWID